MGLRIERDTSLKKISLILFAFLMLNLCCSAQSEELSLDGNWSFKIDPDNAGESGHWYDPSATLYQGWDSIPVPYNWDLLNRYAGYSGKAWYRRNVSIPQNFRGRSLRLVFEGVANDAKLWLNGKELGANNIGFLPFGFEVTDLIKVNEANELIICVDNSRRLGALWNWGGIRRPVKLLADQGWHIVNQQVAPVVDLSKRMAKILVNVQLKNTTRERKKLNGRWQLKSGDSYISSVPFSITIEPGAEASERIETSITGKNFHLWDLDAPSLYSSIIHVEVEGRREDVQDRADKFGLRKFEIDTASRVIRLNGKPIRPVGFNLVPEDRMTGNTLPLYRVMEDVDLLKSLGVSMARLSHMPLTKEFLDYLDEKGILIIAEIPVWGADQHVKKDDTTSMGWLSRMISRDFNHPCIIGWSVGNEIGHNPDAMEYVNKAIRKVRDLDSTRMALMVSHTAHNRVDPIIYSDLGLVNKYGKTLGSMAAQIHAAHPNKILFFTEYGITQFSEDLDGDVDARSMLDSLRSNPFVVGASYWTLNDYRSNYLNTAEASDIRPWGIVNTFRQKKKAFYSFQRALSPFKRVDIRLGVLSTNRQSLDLVLQPRSVNDIPAVQLDRYTLLAYSVDDNGHVTGGDFVDLPVVRPGDKPFARNLYWKRDSTASAIRIQVVSPLNYTVYDTIMHLKKPKPPQLLFAKSGRGFMNEFPAGGGILQVACEMPPVGNVYKYRYVQNGKQKELITENTSFVELKGFNKGDKTTVYISALNNYGESEAINTGEVITGFGILPPVITYSSAVPGGFFIGYKTQPDDYQFEIQYTKVKGDYSNAPSLKTTAKGVLHVEGLNDGTTYYYRLRKYKQNSYVSDWAPEQNILLNGSIPPPVPVISGAIRKNESLIICFENVHSSTGYMLQYREEKNKDWQEVSINASGIGHFRLTGLSANKTYCLRMAAIGMNGISVFSPVLIAPGK